MRLSAATIQMPRKPSPHTLPRIFSYFFCISTLSVVSSPLLPSVSLGRQDSNCCNIAVRKTPTTPHPHVRDRKASHLRSREQLSSLRPDSGASLQSRQQTKHRFFSPGLKNLTGGDVFVWGRGAICADDDDDVCNRYPASSWRRDCQRQGARGRVLSSGRENAGIVLKQRSPVVMRDTITRQTVKARYLNTPTTTSSIDPPIRCYER